LFSQFLAEQTIPVLRLLIVNTIHKLKSKKQKPQFTNEFLNTKKKTEKTITRHGRIKSYATGYATLRITPLISAHNIAEAAASSGCTNLSRQIQITF
jgi:hypothetical protein